MSRHLGFLFLRNAQTMEPILPGLQFPPLMQEPTQEAMQEGTLALLFALLQGTFLHFEWSGARPMG